MRAWIEGLVFSVLFGAIVGTVFALGYNAMIRKAG